MPKVSVIIPVYNVEPYLRRCLDSVIHQTLSDIEIICINDCSPDNSLAILQEYAAKDPRVKVIDFAENKGVSVARNTGMDAATGEYIGFVDSDDYVDLDFYEKLYARAKSTGADVAKGTYKYENRKINVSYEQNEKIREDKTNFAIEFSSAIYKTLLIKTRKIAFPVELTYREDSVFAFSVGLITNKIETVDDAMINITKREDAASWDFLNNSKQIVSSFEGVQAKLDIANNASINAESYSYVFGRLIKNHAKLFKNENDEIKKIVVKHLLELFSRIEYKDHFKDEKILQMLLFPDEKKLYQYLENPKKMMQLHRLRQNHCQRRGT